MSKITSVLEKFNLIEKTDVEASESEEQKVDYIIECEKIKESKAGFEETIAIANEISSKKEYVEKPIKANSEKNLTIEQIYSLFELELGNINTIFILDSFINALPQNLPQDLIKNSVLNIVNASNINLDTLLADGKQRLTVLNQFINDYSFSANHTIQEYEEEIIKLTKTINMHKEHIRNKENMLEEQSHLVKYETQKITGIVEFFSNND